MTLSAVATLLNGVEPRTLNRFGQLNAVKISGIGVLTNPVVAGP